MKVRKRIEVHLKDDDDVINRWCNAQGSISKSIRFLILAQIKERGYTDFIEDLLLRNVGFTSQEKAVAKTETYTTSKGKEHRNEQAESESGAKKSAGFDDRMKNIFDDDTFNNL